VRHLPEVWEGRAAFIDAGLLDPAMRASGDEHPLEVAVAARHGLSVRYVISTHSHKDHVAGNAHVIEKTQAVEVLHESTPHPCRLRVTDNEELALGSLKMRFLHTPGHIPDHLCIQTEGNLLTGDILFVGKVGGREIWLSNAGKVEEIVEQILEIRGIGAMASRILDLDDPGQLADLAVYSPDLSLAQKIEVLETLDVRARLEKVLAWMNEVLAGLSIRKQIREDATERIDKTQREYLLRQQLEALSENMQTSTRYQAVITAQVNFDNLMNKVQESIGSGIRAGEESRIVIA